MKTSSLVRVVLASVLITCLLTAGYFVLQRRHARSALRKQGALVSQMVIAMRRWVANTSTVWVEELHPDFMDFLFKRTFESEAGKKVFYSKNPALVTRELSDLFSNFSDDVVFKVTSDNYRYPSNVPTDFEKAALKRFRADKDLAYIDGINAGEYYYLQPIQVVESCLTCHGKPEDAPREAIEKYGKNAAFGYKIGDIRGAVSVSIPRAGLSYDGVSAVPLVALSILALIAGLCLLWVRSAARREDRH